MENRFIQEGFTFQEIKSTNKERPYKVRCMELGTEKDSALSYEDAANLIIQQYRFSEKIKLQKSKDIEYVRKVFSETLIGRKKTQCDELVKEYIAGRNIIDGTIFSLPSQERFANYKEYKTEYFRVKVIFGNGLQRGATEIQVSRLN